MNIPAEQVAYQEILAFLQNIEIQFTNNEETLSAHFCLKIGFCDVDMLFFIDKAKKLIRLSAPLPFRFAETRRDEALRAAITTNNYLSKGCFDYDPIEHRIVFRICNAYATHDDGTAPFGAKNVYKDCISYIFAAAYNYINNCAPLFFAVNANTLSASDFPKKIKDFMKE